MRRFLGVSILAAGLGAPAFGQYDCPNIICDQAPHTGRQVNISGATLLRGFFFTGAHSNDFLDVNGDGCFGFDENPQPGDPCFPNVVQQLAPIGNYSTWWIVQNRAVGSVEGFDEFITFQLCCDLPEALVTDESTINSQVYANGAGPILGGCIQDNDGDGIPTGAGNGSGTGTPVCPCSIDIAILDVPSRWAAQGPAGAPSFSRKPGQSGYGQNPNATVALTLSACSSQNPGPTLQPLSLLSRACSPTALNNNTLAPDDFTLFDFTFASAPVVPIVNRGVGIANFTYTDLRYLQVTGRMPSGENLAAGCRDAGSGTRNAWANSLGIDPSWANGDNRGGRTTSTARTNLGPCHRVSLCGSSSHLENAVQQRRLAVGYTGIAGSTAAVADAYQGLYEIASVRKDIAGGTQFVRPTVASIVDNDDVNTGYQIAGPATFTTRGDINVSSPLSPSYNPALPQAMENANAADYLYNIQQSIAGFTCSGCTSLSDNQLMPGQFLARTFFLFDGLDARQSLTDPTVFTPQTPNAELRAFILANNNLGTGRPADGIVTPDYGAINTAGLVPNRGSSYGYFAPGGRQFPGAPAGVRLSTRNRIQGDFLYDFARNVNDIPNMMAAFAAGRDGDGVPLYTQPVTNPPGGEPINAGDLAADVILVDVIGDFDGSGTFDAADIRYFADGLAMTTGANPTLNRAIGFCRVDQNWTTSQTGRPAGNFFNTTVVRPDGTTVPYNAGVSRFDVAGAASVAKGDAPIGADGVVDLDDLNYILANFGDWNDLEVAQNIDLSCDMNGDLRVDGADVAALFCCAWGAPQGDLDFDGDVDISDLASLLANFGSTSGAGYENGDIDFDGDVDISDLAGLLANFGSSGCNPGSCCN